VTLEQAAVASGRPLDRLAELDRRRHRFAFLPGTYETVVVRDRETGETLEVALDAATGQRVDVAELTRRDRELAASHASRLSPELRDLAVRHPELADVHVALVHAGDATPTPMRASMREIIELSNDPSVQRIDLLEDPEVMDG
jgi:hypothetical protein